MPADPRPLAWATIVAFAVAGGSSLMAQTPEARAVAAAPPVDACSVLTREEIKRTLGDRDPGAPKAGGSSAYSSICYWEATSPKSSVMLYPTVDPREPNGAALKAMLQRGKKARAVAGLGADAFFVEEPGDTSLGTLYLRVSHYRLVISRYAAPTAAADSVLPDLIALAKVAIRKLT